jgi:hypothetical protein
VPGADETGEEVPVQVDGGWLEGGKERLEWSFLHDWRDGLLEAWRQDELIAFRHEHKMNVPWKDAVQGDDQIKNGLF